MALARSPRPVQVFLAILFVRLLSVFVVQTWYVPDEYWQTLEVAHKQVFGYGALTWEWQKGIRSYLYPGVVAILYSFLKITGLDYSDAIVLAPRILQAAISAYADYSFYKWTGGRKWALFLVLTAWFWFYTGSRTLLQTIETAIITVALSKFPFKEGRYSYYEKESKLWIILAVICVFLRPTSALLWIVLGIYNLMTTNEGKLRLLVRTYVPIGVITGGSIVALDSYFHGSLIVTPWEFFRFNILHDIASFYGQHPWHWYLLQGIPAVLGINLVPVLLAIIGVLRRPKENKVRMLFLVAITIHIAMYSLIPHKEFRFVLPLLPLFLYLAQDVIVPWSRKAKKWQLYIVATLILLGNVVPAMYFGLIHQAGTLKVMPLLRDAIPHNRTSVLFLMPCHSTPLYSHLHINVTTRYLKCEPPLSRPYETTESEAFFNNPQRWWRMEYLNQATPNFVVLFDILKGRVENSLLGYRQLYEIPHTQFPEGEVGEKVLVYKKIDSQAKPPPSDDVL
ncbi:hypothetical protein ACJJTC_010902 [Scirpophaga incertulas]